MSKNNPFSEGPIRLNCNHCGDDCGTRAFALCKQRQHCEYPDADHVETVVHGSDGLGNWCDSCGTAQAVKYLEALGIAAVPAADSPGDQTCAECLREVVVHTDPHVAYVIELDAIEGLSIQPLEVLFESRVCAACAAVTH